MSLFSKTVRGRLLQGMCKVQKLQTNAVCSSASLSSVFLPSLVLAVRNMKDRQVARKLCLTENTHFYLRRNCKFLYAFSCGFRSSGGYNPSTLSSGLDGSVPHRTARTENNRARSNLGGSDLFGDGARAVQPDGFSSESTASTKPGSQPPASTPSAQGRRSDGGHGLTRTSSSIADSGSPASQSTTAHVEVEHNTAAARQMGNIPGSRPPAGVGNTNSEQLRVLAGENQSLKAELEALKSSSALLEKGISRLEAEKSQLTADLSAKSAEMESLKKGKADSDTSASVQARELASLQVGGGSQLH